MSKLSLDQIDHICAELDGLANHVSKIANRLQVDPDLHSLVDEAVRIEGELTMLRAHMRRRLPELRSGPARPYSTGGVHEFVLVR